MTKHLSKILKSVVLVGLITVLLTPTILNFMHSFEHESHLIDCDGNHDTHLHEIEFDCSFIQLYATSQIYSSVVNFYLKKILTQYTSLKTEYSNTYIPKIYIGQAQHRGPPLLHS